MPIDIGVWRHGRTLEHVRVSSLEQGRTPRDVVAQVLDGGSRVKGLTFERVLEHFQVADDA